MLTDAEIDKLAQYPARMREGVDDQRLLAQAREANRLSAENAKLRELVGGFVSYADREIMPPRCFTEAAEAALR
jgi:hypothetical protein